MPLHSYQQHQHHQHHTIVSSAASCCSTHIRPVISGVSTKVCNALPAATVWWLSTKHLSRCRGKKVKSSAYKMYSDSKLMLYMFGVELQKRLRSGGSSTDVFSAHPGVAQTDAFRKSDKSKVMARVLASGADVIGQSAGGGAQSLMKCATDPSLTGQPKTLN